MFGQFEMPERHPNDSRLFFFLLLTLLPIIAIGYHLAILYSKEQAYFNSFSGIEQYSKIITCIYNQCR